MAEAQKEKRKVVYLPDDVHARVKAFCATVKVPMTEWIPAALNDLVTAKQKASK